MNCMIIRQSFCILIFVCLHISHYCRPLHTVHHAQCMYITFSYNHCYGFTNIGQFYINLVNQIVIDSLCCDNSMIWYVFYFLAQKRIINYRSRGRQKVFQPAATAPDICISTPTTHICLSYSTIYHILYLFSFLV